MLAMVHLEGTAGASSKIVPFTCLCRSRQLEGTCGDQEGAVQERWLDPDCEYARPIDPSSTHVPMGPAGHSGAGSEAKGLNKPVRPSVTADRTQDGTKGAMASDPYAFKGQRVRKPGTDQPLLQALHWCSPSCSSCDSKPVRSRAAMHQPCCAHAQHGEGYEGQSSLQSVSRCWILPT